MFFTRLGYALSIFAMILGAYKIIIGFGLASGQVALSRYVGKYSSTGEVIDSGIYAIIFSIALGILTEIRYALRDRA